MVNWRRRHPPGFPPPGRRPPLRPINSLLFEANRLFEQGDFEGAACAFDKLSEQAIKTGNMRGPIILIQSGRAWILAGDFKSGLEKLKRGLDYLKNQDRWDDLRRLALMVIENLQRDNYEELALDIQNHVSAMLAEATLFAEMPKTQPMSFLGKRVILPLHCPYCGAPVNSKFAKWVDQITAICDYCGNMMRGDEQ